MSDLYEGSIAPIGTTEDWSEPHDALAPTPYVAAQKILSSHGESGEVDNNEEVQICVRQIGQNGDPLSDWYYFTGKTWCVWHSSVSEIFVA